MKEMAMDILNLGNGPESATKSFTAFISLIAGIILGAGVAIIALTLATGSGSGTVSSAVAATTDAVGVELTSCDQHDDGTVDVAATITAPDSHGRSYTVPVVFIDDDGYVVGDAMVTVALLPPGQVAKVTTRGWVTPSHHIQRCEIATA